MKMIIKTVSAALLALLLMAGSALPCFAEDASVTYDGQAAKFIFAPGSEQSPTDLFTGFKDVMPGDSLTQQIVVRNNSAEKKSVKVYLRSAGADQDSKDFLENMSLTVENNGSLISSGSADGAGGLGNWVLLGTFAYGSKTVLNLTLNVSMDMDEKFSGAEGGIDWEFKVDEVPSAVKPTAGNGSRTAVKTVSRAAVRTGDDGVAVWMFIAALSLFTSALTIFCRRRRKTEE